MQHANAFKSWISNKKRETPLGTWLMAAAPTTAEALSYSGFDFLVVDMEHVPIEFSDLAHILRAIRCGQSQAVVRLAWNDQILVKRALDAGAQTLMLPFIQNKPKLCFTAGNLLCYMIQRHIMGKTPRQLAHRPRYSFIIGRYFLLIPILG